MPIQGLEALDGKLLDGLQFCTIAYDIFDAIRAAPRGLEELRLLRTTRAKKLLEEILPIASFIQHRYEPGFRLRVRWCGGNQGYDAICRCSGTKVEHLGIPERQHLEVTTAVHPSEYLAREHLHREGFSFGPHGMSRDSASRQTLSAPTIRSGGDVERELASKVRARIAAKAAKPYPRNTSLLVRCVVNTPVLDDEWIAALRLLREDECPQRFREVVLIEPVASRVTTLFVRRRHSRRRSNTALHQTPASARGAAGGQRDR